MSRYSTLLTRLPEETDALLVTSEKNQRYFTGFPFTDGYVLLTRKGAYLFTDFRFIEAARREARPEFEVLCSNSLKSVREYLEKDGVKTLGYEDWSLSCHALEGLKKALPGITLTPAGTVIEDMRVYKDEEEIGCIVKAQRIAEAALEHLLRVIRPDMTEIEVAAELELAMRRGGASGTSFDTIAVSGTLSACPHGVPRPVKLEKGFLTLDFGALYKGYCSDMTRTFVLGKADGEMKKVYDTVLRAQTAAIDFVRLGVDCGEVDRVARDLIDGEGYRGCFGHGLGHGVGMFIHERPGFNAANKGVKVAPGHVLTVEPGIYLEGKYGVRIEDMLVCHADSVEDITLAPKNLTEIF